MIFHTLPSMKIFLVTYLGKKHTQPLHTEHKQRKQTRSYSISNANVYRLPHLERVKVVLETRVVVNAAVVVPEVIIHFEGHGDRSRFDQGLQHEFFVARPIVSANMDVLADIGPGT